MTSCPRKRAIAGQSVAQDRAPDMADMHRFGHVRRTEIDHDPFPGTALADTEPLVSKQFRAFLLQGRAVQSEINEAGSGNARRLGDIGDVEMGHDLCRHLSGIFPPLFSEHHGRVGLVIAKTRIGGGRQLPALGQTGLGQRLAQSLGQNGLERLHEVCGQSSRFATQDGERDASPKRP